MQPVAPRRLGSFKLEIGEELASSEEGSMDELASSKDITCPGACQQGPRHDLARSTQPELCCLIPSPLSYRDLAADAAMRAQSQWGLLLLLLVLPAASPSSQYTLSHAATPHHTPVDAS